MTDKARKPQQRAAAPPLGDGQKSAPSTKGDGAPSSASPKTAVAVEAEHADAPLGVASGSSKAKALAGFSMASSATVSAKQPPQRSRGSWSIRTKFLAVLVVLLLGSTFSFLVLAIRLFEDDKTAYVYDGSLVIAEAVAAETETLLRHVIKVLDTVATSLEQERNTTGAPAPGPGLARTVLAAESEIVAATVYQWEAKSLKDVPLPSPSPPPAPQLAYVAASFLEDLALEPTYFERLDKARPVPLDVIAAKGLLLLDASMADGVPLLSLGYASAREDTQTLSVARVKHERLLRILSKSETNTTYLIDAGGTVLLDAQTVRSKDEASAAEDSAAMSAADASAQSALRQTVISRVLNKKARSGTFEEHGPENLGVIAAYTKLGVGDLTVISEISLDKAFLATRKLIQRSIAFAVLIGIFALATSALFTKRLTISIEKLFQATRKVGAGDFQVTVEARSNDEIGALAQSFNHMTGQIVSLLGQVRDKARMEKELETARVVQENLFPAPTLRYRNLDLASYYMPASECGGDWCGYLTFGDQAVVLLGDATGHGVPAALITAAAQSCCMTLFRAATRKSRFVLSARQIMEYLNFAVFHAAHGKVKMTFCVSVIDLAHGTMASCNASHEMPLIYRHRQEGEALRRELVGADPDPCLGESLDSRYRQTTTKLHPGDVVVWYTDGLLACRNGGGEEWGERRFVGSLASNLAHSASAIKERIIEDAFDFCKDGERDDDVTCIVAKLGTWDQASLLPASKV